MTVSRQSFDDDDDDCSALYYPMATAILLWNLSIPLMEAAHSLFSSDEQCETVPPGHRLQLLPIHQPARPSDQRSRLR